MYNNALYYPIWSSPQPIPSTAACKLRSRLREWHGLHAQLSYTYSHAIDNASDPMAPTCTTDTFLP